MEQPTLVSMKKKTVFLIFLFYLILIFLVFRDLPKTFFQQDEWAIFGFLIYWGKAGLSWFQRLFVYEQEVHILPFSNLLSYFQFKQFGLNFTSYAVLSIFLHLLNSFLVFYLSYLILKKKWLGFVTGALFAVNSISHQAITWVATTTGTVGVCPFLLLSLIFFAKRKITLSYLMFVISLGFKETSLFLFIFLPVFWLIFSEKKTWQNLKKIFIPLFCLGILYFGLRLFLLVNAPPSSTPTEVVSQPASLVVYAYRFLTLPLKAISQSFIPANQILDLSSTMVKLAYPYFIASDGLPNPYLVESVAADIISYILTTIILVLLFFTFKYLRSLKEDNICKSLIFSLSFIALGSLPFIFIPGKAGYFSIFEPRHFYLLSFGSSLLLGIMIFTISRWLTKRFKLVLLVVFLIPIVFFHAFKIRSDIKSQVEIGQLRKSILNQISSAYPKLPEKVIFYTESDKPFYGLPEEEKILPFQSGFGQTLLVWHNVYQEKFPACFFEGKFLYVLLGEDYKFCQDRGFGYFRHLDKLAEAIKENNLTKENVIAFGYNSEDQSLTDITLEIRSKL